MKRKREKEIQDERRGKSRRRANYNSKRILLEEGMMEKLNSDLVLEILTQLPTESVLQCRKVCKLWRDLLGKPKIGMLFVHSPRMYRGETQLYYREQSSPTVSLNSTEELQNFYKTVTKVSLPNLPRSFHLVGSCNGLICYREPHLFGYVIYISNPVTGERIRLPDTPRGRSIAGPRSSNEFVGFGYCLSTKKYKVVTIDNLSKDKIRERVYTVGDGNWWREREFTFDTKMFTGCQPLGIFANGAVHWLSERSNRDIVVFDLKDDSLRFLPSPPGHIHSGSYKNVHLWLLEGNLCLYYIKHNGVMDIWVFRKNNFLSKEHTYFNSFTWTKGLNKKWNSSSTPKCDPLTEAGTLLPRNDSEILLWKDDHLSCYDPATLTKLWYAKGPNGIVAVPHMNSLVSLKNLGENLVDC